MEKQIIFITFWSLRKTILKIWKQNMCDMLLSTHIMSIYFLKIITTTLPKFQVFVGMNACCVLIVFILMIVVIFSEQKKKTLVLLCF